jgi:hypothetical protein
MHNIHDIKSICHQNVFIFKMGYPKYKISTYKPTQE